MTADSGIDRSSNPADAEPEPSPSGDVPPEPTVGGGLVSVASAERCPYCESAEVVRRGWRRNKRGDVQLYQCGSCAKTFSGSKLKGRHYPARVILDGVSFYHLGFSYAESSGFLQRRYGIKVAAETLSSWVHDLRDLCTYSRLRDQGVRLYGPHQVIESLRLQHRQTYQFRYHRAKMALQLQDYKHGRFGPLRELLDVVGTDCPHQLFLDADRASELRAPFALDGVKILEKSNHATRLADFVLQTVTDNKLRHEVLQKFMLANDSVTVATELPVFLDREGAEHMRTELGFDLPFEIERAVTGHIDIVQVRNGYVHVLDYKPGAKKERAVGQLTIYALALSRLTGLRLFDFRCAWFDDKSYYEFFPLHVVHKKKTRSRKRRAASEA